MAANPRGSMRPNGRSPPFLAIGLCVALVILGFNYWSLSARNGEQANEIALMESELRLVNAKKTSSEKRSEALADKVADLEKEMTSQKEVIANKMAEFQTEKQLKEECATRINVAEEENVLLKEKLESCVAEKNSYISEVDQLKGDAEVLKNHQCSESNCQTFVKLSREQTLQEISQVAGNAPLIALYNKGGDVGRFQDQLKDLAAQQNVPIQDGALQQQNQVMQQQQQQQQPQQPDAHVDSQQQQEQHAQESPKDGSQNHDDNKGSGVPQPGNDKDVDVKDDEEDVDAQVAGPDVDHQNENGDRDENDHDGALFPADAGDGTNAVTDDDLDNDDNYEDDDDDDGVLDVNKDENDYDYDENEDDDDDNDDVMNYRYGNPMDKNDMERDDNAIDDMFKRQQEMEQGR